MGPGAAPLCFCSRGALLLICVLGVPKGTGAGGRYLASWAYLSNLGGLRTSSPPSAWPWRQAAATGSCGAPRTHFWLLGPPASQGVCAFGFSVPRQPPFLQAPGYASLATLPRGRALLLPVPAARAVGSKAGLRFRPRMCLRRGCVFSCYCFHS